MNILITNNRLSHLAGSEVVCLELIEALTKMGHSVDVFTNACDGTMRKELGKTSARVFVYPSQPKTQKYDLAWIHHQLLPLGVASGKIKVASVVFHHMSPYLPIESPFIPTMENALADYIYANSEETKRSISHILTKRVEVLGNPAPSEFRRARIKPNEKVSKILVVSNHPPSELMDALQLLEARHGIGYNHFGEGGTPKRIHSEDFDSFDLIISIGKTVQYSILNRKPIYVYDHFGGPGFLTKKNYAESKDLNFSGRGFSKKSATQIANEIANFNLADYNSYLQVTKSDLDKFDLQISLVRILSKINTPSDRSVIKERDLGSLNELQKMIHWMFSNSEEQAKIISHQKSGLNTSNNRLADLKVERRKLMKSIKERDVRLNELQSMLVVRFAKKINRFSGQLTKKLNRL